MSMASQELKDIKLTLHQILQNQTAMMAQIVLLNKQQQAQQHQQQANMANVLNNPAINKSFLDAIKSRIFGQIAKSPQQLQALQSSSGLKLDSNKHPPSSNAPKIAIPSSAMLNGPQKRKVELPMDDITNSKHRRAHSQKPECEVGMYANAELEAKKKSNNDDEKQSKANKVILQNQRFCSLCNAGVKIGSVVDHVWEHLKRKMVEDQDPNNVNVYGFLCDAADCNFRTNKLELANDHAKNAHPNLHCDKMIIDNTENNSKIFKIALNQCFETIEQAEKEMINLRCFE